MLSLFSGNAFQQLYNIVDTMVAGYNLGDEAISAIGSTNSLYSLIINLAFGLNAGYSIVMTRYFGRKDMDNLRKSVAFSIIYNMTIGIVLTIFSTIFLKQLMHLIKVPDEIFDNAYAYFIIILGGMLSTILYNMFAGILRAVGNSKMPLYFLILSSGINICMDLLFVMVFNWGIMGLALATITAQTISALVSGIYLWKYYKEIIPNKKDFQWNKLLCKALFSMGISMALMSCVVSLGSVFFQGATNELGSQIITAHTTARKIIGILNLPISSLSTALSTFVGQNYGANKMERIRSTLFKVILLVVIISVIFFILVFLLGKWLLIALTNSKDEEMLKNGILSLRIHFSMFPALGILLCLRNALQAMGHKVTPVISSSMELGLKLLSVFSFIPKYGFIAVCLTEPVIWGVCMIFLVIVYIYLVKIKKIYNIEKYLCILKKQRLIKSFAFFSFFVNNLY